ncbi:hypothetical protein PMAYCL1PPCAC_16989, partial [Pristionchus mayeri]
AGLSASVETIREKPIEKKQRQVSMEWEFLASILDRILLIVFITAVVLITLGLIVSVWMAEYQYDHAEQS